MSANHRRPALGTVLLAGVVLLASVALPARAADVAILGHALSDNGDHDDFADTNETVSLQITVQNLLDTPLTDVTALLSSDDPKIECLVQHAVYVGDLAAGETRFIAGSFVFKVADVSRSDPYEEFRARFRVVMTSGVSGEVSVTPEELLLDLDLDVTGGAGSGSYFEGFESGNFGSLTTMNIDAGKFSLEASDGYRCQYSDPDWVNSNNYGNDDYYDCWLGATALQGDAFFWQIADGDPGATVPGRSYSGRYSAYMGSYVASVDDWTTPMANLEALASDQPVNLGVGRVCETTRTIACTEDTDCPMGESCVGIATELMFKHQIDFVDYRLVGGAHTHVTSHGAAIGVQLADDVGNPVGDWIKIYAYTNSYEAEKDNVYANCQFDPIDDGSTEDDFFDPSDPERKYGPSTLCYPELVYAYMGDTDAPFDPNEIGHAGDGPGLAGASGEGTWVESRFNLQQFRGRRIRVRFISGGIKAGTAETYESLFAWNPIAGDDGWWIDDIVIADTLAVPAVLSVDAKDNSGLPGVTDGDADRYCDSDCDDGDADCNIDCTDADSDGMRICNGDCQDSNPDIYLGAEEVCDGVSNDCDHPQWPLVDYWTPTTIAERSASSRSVVAADVDGDGDLDAASASYGDETLAWYENTTGDGSAWATHTVSATTGGAEVVYAVDMDGDEDLDLLSASYGDETLAWYENTAGDGSAWTERVITTSAYGANDVMAADVDGDDDLDVLAAARDSNDRIRWYENTAGDGSSWTARTITTSTIYSYSVFGADLDGDEDLDVLIAANDLFWFENTQGDGSKWTEHLIDDYHSARLVQVADLDDDTDPDLLVGHLGIPRLEWHENAAGDGSVWTHHVLAEVGYDVVSISAADMDDDGDMDALSASRNLDEVMWCENVAGDGSAWVVRPISWTADGAASVCAGDVDDDGRMDVLSVGYDEVTWYFQANLELDDDGDGIADCEGDCDDRDLEVWSAPGEVQDLTLLEDRQTLVWSAPAEPGSTSVVYNTLRGELPDGFLGATCVEWGDGSDTQAVDTGAPADGAVYYYLVVAVNGCGHGCAGTDSDDEAREVCACP